MLNTQGVSTAPPRQKMSQSECLVFWRNCLIIRRGTEPWESVDIRLVGMLKEMPMTEAMRVKMAELRGLNSKRAGAKW